MGQVGNIYHLTNLLPQEVRVAKCQILEVTDIFSSSVQMIWLHLRRRKRLTKMTGDLGVV